MWSWNWPKTGKTFPAASRALRWGPDELFGTSAACEEHLGSRPATETLLKSFGGHSGAPRPHWWRWRCHLPSRRDCLLPISVSSPLQCQSATLRRTCILSHLSSDRNSVTEPYYSFSFEFWEILTIPFLLNRWSSIHHLQSHVPPSKEKIEIAFSKIQLFIFFTLSHLREISKSKSGSELQAFPHQRLWMSFVGDCGLYKEQPSDQFWKIKRSKMFCQFKKTWHLSTKSSCSFNDISRVSTWKVPTKPNCTVTHHYCHLKPKKHHHDDGSWGRETLASQTRGSRAVWESGES